MRQQKGSTPPPATTAEAAARRRELEALAAHLQSAVGMSEGFLKTPDGGPLQIAVLRFDVDKSELE